jgi:hypothetical protein
MPCDKLTFSNVTPAQFTCISKSVTDKTGIVIGAYSGTESKAGFKVTWNYSLPQNAQSGTLMIQCLDSPWDKPCDAFGKGVNPTIKALVAACGVT